MHFLEIFGQKTRKKQHICRENCKYAFGENFMATFALAERLPTSATLITSGGSASVADIIV